MTDKLLVVMPSRGRPERFATFLEAFRATRVHLDTRVVCCLDLDDPTRNEYPHMFSDVGWYTNDQRMGFAPRLSQVAMLYADSATAIASFGDDHVPRTKGWDAHVLEALRRMGGGIVYPNDLFQGHKCPTAPIMSSDLVRALGYYSPPQLQHMYVDDFWLYLGEGLRRIRYLGDVIVEHMHPAASKAEPDATYDSAVEHVVTDGVEWTRFVSSGELDAVVQRVRDRLGW